MAMRMNNIKMTTTVSRLKLLDIVKANYEQHKKIVKESQEGYRKKAIEELNKRKELLEQGKVVNLSFTLQVPVDYSEVYKNSIEMLEWNTEESVQLEADEFRQLVRDEWDWMEGFLKGMSWLSETAGGALVAKGYSN